MKDYIKFQPKSLDPEKFKLKLLIYVLVKQLIEKGIIDENEFLTLLDSEEIIKDEEARLERKKSNKKKRERKKPKYRKKKG